MLTVIIPCLNERHNIEACVASARMLGCDILIADCGSTDGTIDLLRNEPDCRVIERSFVNYANFKNWAIPQAKHPWVFVLDADERVTPELAREVRQTLANASDEIDAYWIGRRTFFLGHQARFGPWLNDGVYRLFRRDNCRYGDCRVHESLLYDQNRGGRLHNKLLHYTVNSYDDYLAKYGNYTRWGANDQWDRGRRPSTFRMLTRPFLRFLWLYIFQGGFLDGAIGVQTCMLQAFFVSFIKQGRLWERVHSRNESGTGHDAQPTLVAQNRRAA